MRVLRWEIILVNMAGTGRMESGETVTAPSFPDMALQYLAKLFYMAAES